MDAGNTSSNTQGSSSGSNNTRNVFLTGASLLGVVWQRCIAARMTGRPGVRILHSPSLHLDTTRALLLLYYYTKYPSVFYLPCNLISSWYCGVKRRYSIYFLVHEPYDSISLEQSASWGRGEKGGGVCYFITTGMTIYLGRQ